MLASFVWAKLAVGIFCLGAAASFDGGMISEIEFCKISNGENFSHPNSGVNTGNREGGLILLYQQMSAPDGEFQKGISRSQLNNLVKADYQYRMKSFVVVCPHFSSLNTGNAGIACVTTRQT